MKYADIIIDISLESLDRIFQYRVPDTLKDQLRIGSCVQIPFGKGNRKISGYVAGFSNETDYDPEKIKSILALTENATVMESQMMELADWISRRYGCTRAQALKTVWNVKRQVRGGKEYVYTLIRPLDEVEAELKKLSSQPRFASRAAILTLLFNAGNGGKVAEKVIRRQISNPESALKTLVRNGWIQKEERSNYRVPYRELKSRNRVCLNAEQIQAIEGIWKDERKVQLLYGVTGSGKTEVYMELIRRMMEQGRQTIVLIPEITLTYQNISRFREYFGDRVSILNSRMSEGERYDQYIRAQQGEIDIVIGPRSALFMPFQNLGLIIVDEAHDTAYKSDTTPKYHAVEVAIKRASMCGAKVVLGSATPSVSDFYKAQQGTYGIHYLKHRAVPGAKAVETVVVDLRDEMRQKNYSIFSRRLQAEIRERLRKHEQTLLFLNRRGYAGFVSCRSCGHVISCPHCDVSLTYHKKQGHVLKCHYCGMTIPVPERCPECGSPYIGSFGVGTERVEEALRKMFPEARVLRADRDTMMRKHAHEEIFGAFARGEADVLVGTQMIVKGHDFPKVSLVGVLAADLSMFSGDYMAGERTFQLLTQAEGRAGRRAQRGLAVIQTYQPEHYAVTCAAAQDYESFYKQEMLYRKLMNYPPWESMMVMSVEGLDEVQTQKGAGRLAEAMRTTNVLVLPPADGFRFKERDFYRKVVYLKSKSEENLIESRIKAQKIICTEPFFNGLNVQFDINPINLY